jgi:hypothetical protein
MVWQRVGLMGGQKRFDMLRADSVGTTDANGLELALMDEPLHRPTRNFEPMRDFGRRENFGFQHCAFEHDSLL